MNQHFRMGFKAILPLAPGIIPFGAVMGSSFSAAKLSIGQALLMNTFVYAGASQLATVDLMKLNAAVVVVVLTGLIVNLRFVLYSAAMSPYLRDSEKLKRLICAFTLTDQSYAAMTANLEKFSTNKEALDFYLGTAASMLLIWHGSVISGYAFGNFAPESLALDFAVPLSFIALVIPTLKTRGHKFIASLSSVLSLCFYGMPMKTGLMVSALISISVAWIILGKRHD